MFICEDWGKVANESDHLGCNVWFEYELPRLGAGPSKNLGRGHFERC